MKALQIIRGFIVLLMSLYNVISSDPKIGTLLVGIILMIYTSAMIMERKDDYWEEDDD